MRAAGVRTVGVRAAILTVEDSAYIRFAAPIVAFLPAPLAYGVALLQGDIRYRLGGARESRRRQTICALQLLFGDRLTPQSRDRMARDYSRIRACDAIDGMRLLGRGRALSGLVEVRGLEHLEAALAGGKGGILCSAHFGSHKSLFSMIGSLGFPITVIARWSFGDESKRIGNLSKLYYRLGNGMPVTPHLVRPNIERKPTNLGSAVQAARVLRMNEFIGIMIDSIVMPNDPSKPIAFDFLNRTAMLAPGATAIAQLTGAPVMVVLLHRAADWRHQILEISPPIIVDSDPIDTFRQCLAQIEATIRRYPAQWRGLPLSGLVARGMVSPDEARRINKEYERSLG